MESIFPNPHVCYTEHRVRINMAVSCSRGIGTFTDDV